MTDPRNIRRWLLTLADHYHSLLVSGVARNALVEIEMLEADIATAEDEIIDLKFECAHWDEITWGLRKENDRLREALATWTATARPGCAHWELIDAARKETSK